MDPEEWQTQEGDANARKGGETARYLPKKAWDQLSDAEKRETENKKRQGSREGKQFVPNTKEAKRARTSSQAAPLEGYDDLSVDEVKKKATGLSKEEVREIVAYEKRNKNRKTLVEALDQSS